jgi:hypothetical protein
MVERAYGYSAMQYRMCGCGCQAISDMHNVSLFGRCHALSEIQIRWSSKRSCDFLWYSTVDASSSSVESCDATRDLTKD